MALLAGRWQSRLHVVGIRSRPKIGHVASGAIHAGQIEIVIDVALRTLQAGVSTRQREACDVVVEGDRSPVCGVVARGAILGKLGLHVIGILGARKILQMATDAIGDGDLVVPIDMAGSAIQRRVHAGQSEAREPGVIKLGAQPTVHSVASLANSGELQRPMVWGGRGKGIDVARHAFCG